MSIFDKQEKKSFELIPEGTYPARVYMLVDLGTHSEEWEGKETFKHRIHLGFELIGTTMTDGRPFVISKQFNISNGKYGPYIAKASNLHKLLRSWLKFDEKKATYADNLPDIVGSPALISVGQEAHKKYPDSMKNTVEGILPYKDKELPAAINEAVVFGLADRPTKEKPGVGFDKLYPWQQREVLACLELNGGIPARDEQLTVTVPSSLLRENYKPNEEDIPF